MKKKLYILGSMLTMALLTSCSNDAEEKVESPTLMNFSVTSQIVPMQGKNHSRISDDGREFITDDLIRLKMVTPFDQSGKHSAEFGESTWGGSIDNYFLLRYDGDNKGTGYTEWTTNGFAKYGFDLNGDGDFGDNAPSLQYHSQQTPYVYTANTWDRGLGFKTDGKWRTQFKSTFYADQSIQANFRASDLLWAQTITQTCTSQVTLSFHHVLSELYIEVPGGITNATLTLENMPDVDQQEFVVGDKYAKYYYNYGDKLSFTYISHIDDVTKNGTVIGIATTDGDNYALKGLDAIAHTATYTAYKADDTHFRVIVPPMGINEKAQIVLREVTDDGSAKKYVYPLKDKIDGNIFEANNCYQITLSITGSSTGGGE